MDIENKQVITRTTIESTLKNIIVEVIGEDFITVEEINIEDNLAEDLEMESIDIVQFADLVKSEYGEKADLTKWMSAKNLDEIINLKFNDILDFLEETMATE